MQQVDVRRIKHVLLLGGQPEWRDPGFGYFEWRDSGFAQNLGRNSGFATYGGSGIKSFFNSGYGISIYQRDRDLHYFAFFGGIRYIIPSILPIGSLDCPFQNPRSYIQT